MKGSGFLLKKGLHYLQMAQNGMRTLGFVRQGVLFIKQASLFSGRKQLKLQKKQEKQEEKRQKKVAFQRKRAAMKDEIKWMGRIIPFCIKKFY